MAMKTQQLDMILPDIKFSKKSKYKRSLTLKDVKFCLFKGKHTQVHNQRAILWCVE